MIFPITQEHPPLTLNSTHLGMFALMWVVAWLILVSDSPEADRHISEREKNYILDSLQDDQTSRPVSSLH